MSRLTRWKLQGLICCGLAAFGVAQAADRTPYAFNPDFFLECGPEKQAPTGLVDYFKQREYFEINKDKSGHYVVTTNGYQFPSFAKVTYYETYSQNGAVTWSKVKKLDNLLLISLFDQAQQGQVGEQVIAVDLNALTYKATAIYIAPNGVCWRSKYKPGIN